MHFVKCSETIYFLKQGILMYQSMYDTESFIVIWLISI